MEFRILGIQRFLSHNKVLKVTLKEKTHQFDAVFLIKGAEADKNRCTSLPISFLL